MDRPSLSSCTHVEFCSAPVKQLCTRILIPKEGFATRLISIYKSEYFTYLTTKQVAVASSSSVVVVACGMMCGERRMDGQTDRRTAWTAWTAAVGCVLRSAG